MAFAFVLFDCYVAFSDLPVHNRSEAYCLLAAYSVMQAVWTMDRSDEESENSSENSFNEMVTAAMAGGYAIMSMMIVPPQVNPGYHQPDLSGRQWVDNLLRDRSRCFDNFRMQPENFQRLHYILSSCYGLASTREIDSIEALGMFFLGMWDSAIAEANA